MNGDLGRGGWTGPWMALALCALAACNAAPGAGAGAATTGAAATATSVVDAVRVATDRSGAQRDVLTLPNGQRMRRVSLGSGSTHVLVGRMGPDGKPLVSCVDSAPAAAEFLRGEAQGNGQ